MLLLDLVLVLSEICADGNQDGIFGGTPGFSGCANPIPEFSSIALFLAIIGSFFTLMYFRKN